MYFSMIMSEKQAELITRACDRRYYFEGEDERVVFDIKTAIEEALREGRGQPNFHIEQWAKEQKPVVKRFYEEELLWVGGKLRM